MEHEEFAKAERLCLRAIADAAMGMEVSPDASQHSLVRTALSGVLETANPALRQAALQTVIAACVRLYLKESKAC